ncbi:MAG: hypothetical protein J5885_04190 [Clostridia bacterium]|nr:hypothetical protein [Clostridia bacterium]
MAKLVTKFRYYKPGGRKKIGGYLKYIATREGVERCDDSKKFAPVTYNQKELVARLLRDYPDSAEMLEYEDYVKTPTIGNASEFISRAIEDNAQSAMGRKTYADYIATRPGVEKQGAHGLFTEDDTEIVLSRVSEELNEHRGNVWTVIVSLRREDAERLGYNNANKWRTLLRSHTQELADALKIPLPDLRWYAAFHNESHHPHIHLLAYTDDPKVGYLSKKGVRKMRSVLGQTIFRDELDHVYREQTDRRNVLKKDWKELLESILQQMNRKEYANPAIEEKLLLLSERLFRIKGKKVYGYLKRDVKDLIDSIVDLLAEDENIRRLYNLWYEKKYEILKTYTSELLPKIPLSQNKEFKSIKNEIIREAMRIRVDDNGKVKILPPYQKPTCAPAVSRLFGYLCNLFREKVSDNGSKHPTVDKKQRREIEAKKNAEIIF